MTEIQTTELSVFERSGILVVDSRLIAQELGIQHKNFLATLDKYIGEIEKDWGQVAFETETVTNSVGASNSVKYALLTEQQATLLMTYSRNTEQVRQCKRHLVKAFEKAKLALSSVVESRVAELEKKLIAQSEAIALLQSQVQTLLPPSADFMPPGWDKDVWQSLQPQDKRHFRYIFRRRGFRPSHQGKSETPALPFSTEEIRLNQRSEIEQFTQELSPRQQQQKEEMLKRFWEES